MYKTKRFYSFTRRALIVGVSKIALASTLLGRMYYLQILQSDHYKTLSEDNRIKLKLTPPLRGLLLDQYGTKLAVNSQEFQLTLNREEAKDTEVVLEKVRKLITLDESDLEKAFKQMKRLPKFFPVPIKTGLTWKEVSMIEARLRDLPGILVEEGVTRDYIHKDMLSHTLGYVQPIAESDTIDKKFLRLPNFKIGRAGLEKMYDDYLRGNPGIREVEVSATHREIREVTYTPSEKGIDMDLTLDFEVQKFTFERLSKEKSAATVVMDVTTGGVLVMASTPSFDPNLFTEGIDQKNWKRLTENKYGILMNKATSGQYAPGSTFKMMVALAALENGIISPNDRIVCSGGVNLGSHRFKCWKRGGHGARNMFNGIANSCDVYFYRLAERVGVDRIAETAKKFGLGMRTELKFHNEKPGIIPSVAWKKKRYGQNWYKGETLNTGIGQGYVLTTPLQLAQMTARLATGLQVTPTFYLGKKTPAFDKLDIDPKNLEIIQEAMYQVVNGPGGTAMRSMIREEGMKMAGKTGTSQVVSLTRAQLASKRYRDPYILWRHKDHALFVAFAPYHKPKYAIAVLVEHGGGGSRAAAPIAKEIMLYLQQLRKV